MDSSRRCNRIAKIPVSKSPSKKTIAYFCHVKILQVLFALYILMLPCMPCSDSGECNEHEMTGVSLTQNGEDHPTHEKEACTPFCICSCCGQHYFMEYRHAKQVASRITVNSINIINYDNPSLPSDYFGTIWQPPQNS